MKFLAIIAFALLAACTGDQSGHDQNSIKVSASSFEGDWPLTVDSGEVYCAPGSAAVFSAYGQDYQLNGAASSQGYKPINPIWRDNPEIPGTKIPISDLIDAALEQC